MEKRFLAGSIDLPTSAPVSPFYRAASQRSGSLLQPCSPASARSSRMNWKKQRMLLHLLPWQALQRAPDLGVTLNYKYLQSHTCRAVSGNWKSLEESKQSKHPLDILYAKMALPQIPVFQLRIIFVIKKQKKNHLAQEGELCTKLPSVFFTHLYIWIYLFCFIQALLSYVYSILYRCLQILHGLLPSERRKSSSSEIRQVIFVHFLTIARAMA